jgi:hypothetical protein
MKILPASASRGLLPLALLLALPLGASAQSAEEVLLRALDLHEDRMEGIQGYTVVQEVMGFQVELEFERAEVDGRTVFVPVLPAGPEGDSGDAQTADPAGGMADFYQHYPQIAERAELVGKAAVDGQECFVVKIDDFSGLDLGQNMTVGDQGEFVPKKATLYLDGSDYVLRKMEMEGETISGAQPQPMTAQVALTDYRNVEGMLHPFTIQVHATGAPSGIPQEDLAKARGEMERMEKQLAALPESQRAMVEGMIRPQIEQLEQMLEGGEIDITLTTKEVRVSR